MSTGIVEDITQAAKWIVFIFIYIYSIYARWNIKHQDTMDGPGTAPPPLRGHRLIQL